MNSEQIGLELLPQDIPAQILHRSRLSIAGVIENRIQTPPRAFQSGVHGSRMTGGGFGGSTVTAVAPDAMGELLEEFAREAPNAIGRRVAVRVVSPATRADLID